ncbi:MAG: alpha-galactosidase [Lachnospiraceae bacterium]|nr:alpha-galactosidase [Lachnospiraceae bacterium]
MSIVYSKKDRIWKLDTPHSSYLMAAVDEEGFLGHVYYGNKVDDLGIDYLTRAYAHPFVPSENARERCSFMDLFPAEYPGFGLGDYRTPAFCVRTASGSRGCGLFYRSHKIYAGKPGIPGMPATFAGEDEADTLEILCEDPENRLEVTLYYTAFRNMDVITRSVSFRNKGNEMITLEKVMSLSVDLEDPGYETIGLFGSWARERHICRNPLGMGSYRIGSFRGESSHQEHPFLALCTKGADSDHGQVYGFHFLYSGNFVAEAHRSQFESVRVTMGISPEGFSWGLMPGETFSLPEAAMVYSSEGIGGMSRTFHRLYRKHLIRSPYRDTPRPVLINNWEATYFDFNTEKLIDIAREAAASGIEMLVMDDGWFGARSYDDKALGDWIANEEKLPGGLPVLSERIHELGLKFGIWMEPEMISPDSDLYRAHPDWAIAIPGRTPAMSRCQYVLDITRREVLEYVYGCVRNVLSSTRIEYLKWDMNRQLTDVFSLGLTAEHQGEFYHRYVLAVYELQERLVTDFPDLLLENCSGGGARFDPGMLYYSPQIWCSDDTDAIERLSIQEGTAMVYPLSCMGAHVSDCPNHAVGRNTPFQTRGHVALAGTFGYELDITRIPQEDRRRIPDQIALYHSFGDLIRRGDYYRVANYSENGLYDCWAVIAEDKSEALVTYVQVLGQPNYKARLLILKGLDPDGIYEISATSEEDHFEPVMVRSGGRKEPEALRLSGRTLMNAGILADRMWGDFRSKLYHLKRVEL